MPTAEQIQARLPELVAVPAPRGIQTLYTCALLPQGSFYQLPGEGRYAAHPVTAQAEWIAKLPPFARVDADTDAAGMDQLVALLRLEEAQPSPA